MDRLGSKRGPATGLNPTLSTGRVSSGAPTAPSRAEVPLGPVGGANKAPVTPRPKAAGAWAQFAQGLLQKTKGPLTAMLIGAAALPFAGAPVQAQAAPVEPVVVSAPAQVAPAVTRAAVRPFVAGSIGGVELYAAYVSSEVATLRAQLRQFEAEAPRDPVIQRDLLRLDQVVERFDRLIQQDAQLPAGMLADLDHVLTALKDARPGTLGKVLDQSLRELPSTRVTVPGLDPARVDAQAPRTGAVPRLDGPGDGWLRDLLAASPTDFPDKARAELARYRAVMAGADQVVSRLPDFAFVSPNPLAYDSGDGRLIIPPGARLVNQGGQFTIQAPGLLWQQGGLTVVSQQGAIHLGSDLDGLTAQQVNAQGTDWAAQLSGATLGVSRSRGYGIIKADEATLDLTTGQAHLTKAQLVVGASGDATLIAKHLSATDGGLSLDLEGLRLDQTRAGTSGTAARLRLEQAGTLIQGEGMDVRFGPAGARIEAQDLEVVTGRTTMFAHAAILTAAPSAGGGHLLTVTGDRFGFENGPTALSAQGGDLKLALDAQGQLRSAQLSGQGLQLATRDGQLQLGQGAVDVALDARGVLTRVSGRSERARFTGDDLSLSADRGRVEATFSPDGHLASLTTDAAHVGYQGARGALDVTGGALTAQLTGGQLSTLTASADAARWAGTDGTRADATGGRLGLAFFEDGGLKQADLQTGALRLSDAEGRVAQVTDGQGKVTLRPGGALERVEARAGQVDVTDAGRALSLTGTRLSADFDAAGNLTRAAGETGRLRYTEADGTFIGAGRTQLELSAADGALRHVTLAAQDLQYRGKLGELTAAQGRLEAEVGADGLLQRARFDTRDLHARGDFGQVDVKGAGWIAAQWQGDALSQLSAHADQLDFQHEADRLSVTQGNLDVTVADGVVREAKASFDAASYQAGFGRLDLTKGSAFSVRYGEDGSARLDGFATRLDLAHDAGQLALDGGRVTGELAPDGTAKALTLGAQRLAYAGTAEGDHRLAVDLLNPEAILTQREGGGQQLAITTGAGSFQVDGHRVSLDGVQALTLATTPDGQVDAFTARFPGQLDFVQRDGDLTVLTRGLGASYHREGSLLTLDFAEADVALRSQGLTAHIEGGAALLDEQQLQIQVDRAQVLKAMGADLNVDVENVSLRLTRGEQGALQGLDLALGRLDAQVAGMDVMVRTPTGERVRLSLTADEEGRTIKQAFLQIPEGGEVRLTRDDLDVRLGGQRVSFEHGDDGLYRLRGEGLDIAASTRDARVKVDGGDAQVSLDPATGRLVIDEIRGTRIDVETKDVSVHLDIQELQDFMVRMTGFEGGATGAALHLVPTTDGSTLTAELRAEIGGIPVEVRIRDAHELKALGQVSVNQVHVYAGDPSGRGDIQIGVGPLALQGSAVELVGRYHPYDPGRMLESVHQFVTTGGGELFSGVRFEPDGVLRLGTDREGLNGELAVMLPRQYALPGYRLDLTAEPSLAPGVIGSLGYRSGDVTASAFAGLLPGSHATLHVKQGTAEVAGLRVPERTDLPTTAVAGLRLDLADVDDGHLSAVAGGFVNPMGLTSSRFVEERTPYGAFGGLEYRKDDWFVSGSAVVDVNDGKPQLGGVMFRLGVRF
jgi:hypothetical protein